MIFDAGVFIALENPSQRRVVVALVEKMLAQSTLPITNEPVLAQAWRDPGRQVAMTQLVNATTVFPFGDAKAVGLRCAQSATNDVVDASLAVLADQLDDTILTSDPNDMTKLGAPHVALHP